MTLLYFVFVQSVLLFVVWTLTAELDAAAKPPKPAQDSDPNTRPYSQVFERR
jgi:hypothetical protein